jgi:hypothetical protein
VRPQHDTASRAGLNLAVSRWCFTQPTRRVEWPQPFDDCRGIGNVVVEHSDFAGCRRMPDQSAITGATFS